MHINEDSYERLAHWRTFPLPGGDAAAREPRRSALGLLYELYGEKVWEASPLLATLFSAKEKSILTQMLAKKINSPRTSSAGRLFDAVACLAGLPPLARFEGEAAMALEWAAARSGATGSYPIAILPPVKNGQNSLNILNWEGIARGVLADRESGVAPAEIGAKFHRSLAEAIARVAHAAGIKKVVLTGGCFQNKLLTELAFERLAGEGFHPYIHQRIPPNDGGIAAGQIAAALRFLKRKK